MPHKCPTALELPPPGGGCSALARSGLRGVVNLNFVRPRQTAAVAKAAAVAAAALIMADNS